MKCFFFRNIFDKIMVHPRIRHATRATIGYSFSNAFVLWIQIWLGNLLFIEIIFTPKHFYGMAK